MKSALAALAVLLSPPLALAQAVNTDTTASLLAHERAIVSLVRRVEPAVVSVRRFVKDEKWWTEAKARSVRVAPGWVQVPERDLLYPHYRPLRGASGTVYDFQRILYAAGVGQDVPLEVVRRGTKLEHSVRIDKRPPEAVTR